MAGRSRGVLSISHGLARFRWVPTTHGSSAGLAGVPAHGRWLAMARVAPIDLVHGNRR